MLSPNQPAKFIPLHYKDNIIRVHKHTDLGNVWFVLSDICKVLKLTNPSYISHKISTDNKHAHKLLDHNHKTSVLWVSYNGLVQVFDTLVDGEYLAPFWYWCRRVSLSY